ncbi:MAG: hypothetical protein KBT82_01465 [Marinobacter sp.]|uniref:hypothetical protein n=1 Tax=Marinobacter sp. TaxID=50741 RepID=UPI001B5BFDAF|nr:hypothetical protein [Marinobacter sp.]MBQ0747902.1 hypothetical protein [Marinobacter sp.]MBQ0812849.1 hypothetical protein [Marinobacter sp.]
MKREELEPLIVKEWLKRPADQRGEKDILAFHGHLSQSRPDLLSFRASGDKYQVLKSILRNHVKA